MPLTKEELEKDYTELTEISFDHKGAHLASCHVAQGGAANGKNIALMLKAEDTNQELIKALEQITITMSMEEYFRKFFDMWYSDAELLAKVLGFETEDEYAAANADDDDGMDWWANRLEEKVGKVNILRSCKDVEMKDLTVEQKEVVDKMMTEFIKGIAKDQDLFLSFGAEKEVEKNSSTVSSEEGVAALSDAVVNKTSGKQQKLEGNMPKTKKDEVVKATEATEFEKAQVEMTKMADQIAELMKSVKAGETAQEAQKAEIAKFVEAEDKRVLDGATVMVKAFDFIAEDTQEATIALLCKADATAELFLKLMNQAQTAVTAAAEKTAEIKEDFTKEVGVDGDVEAEAKTFEKTKETQLADMKAMIADNADKL